MQHICCSSVITFLSTQVNASQAVTKFNKVVDSLCVSAVFLQRPEAATLAEWKQTHLSASCHPWHQGPLSPAQDGSSQRNRSFGGLHTIHGAKRSDLAAYFTGQKRHLDAVGINAIFQSS